MFTIRRIHDTHLASNQSAVENVQRILRERFALVRTEDIDGLPAKLRDSVGQPFVTILYVAEQARAPGVQGFALVLRDPVLKFWFLDFLATDTKSLGGIGAALYERVREDAKAFEARGMFFECLPDSAETCPDAALLQQNKARLRFYERWGARPIVGTEYEKPVRAGDECMPHLVCDTLGTTLALRRSHIQKVVRAILERKYAYLCPPEYVEAVALSIKSDPVALRPRRYTPQNRPASEHSANVHLPRYPLIVNEKHDIHHVKERGYVESPIRVSSIRNALDGSGMFRNMPAKIHGSDALYGIHDRDFVNYLKRACSTLPEGKSIYPYVFPIRNVARQPQELAVRAGYYCIDTFTPLNRNAYLAARGAVDCALTAAETVLAGARLAYALVRPPGHHAERRSYGGFCYFNNVAAAAQLLSQHGKVAILDIDYHHGNGQQDIFLSRADVLTISIHGHPNFAYPYFTGFEDEIGAGEGEGFNVNLPLAERTDGVRHRKALRQALERIRAFAPTFLAVSLGLDTAKGDPTGSWSLTADDFDKNGALIGGLNLPTVVSQEGGYKTRSLGSNAAAFFNGLARTIRLS